MAKESMDERIQRAMDQLEQGTKDFFQSEHFKEYLAFLGKFHKYSLNNCILIARQCPESSGRVAGYQTWKKLNRQVKRGAKGIMILAPYTYRKEVEIPGKFDNDGNPLKEVKERISFRPVYVFDESMTEGDPLPEVVKRLDFEVEDYDRIMNALLDMTDCQVFFDDLEGAGDANGYFNPAKREIHIRKGMSNAQTIKTLIHEEIHSILHPETLSDKTRSAKEIEAEGACYVVASEYLKIDTSDYSFGYVASWAEGKPLKELTECLENIKRASKQMIDGLNQRLCLEITQEEADRRSETEEVKRFVESNGIVADSVAVIGTEDACRNRVIYITNSSGSYQAEFVLHGDREKIEHVLRASTETGGDLGKYLEANGIGYTIRSIEPGRVYDYRFNYETGELQPYSAGTSKEAHVLVATEGTEQDEKIRVLNDAMPAAGGMRLSFTSVNTSEEDSASYMDELYSYHREGSDERWPMVVIRYTNVPNISFSNMSLYDFQKMIAKLPDKVLDDRSKYFMVCIDYTYNGKEYQTQQDIDLGRGRVDYLNYLRLNGSHIVHMKNHLALQEKCEEAEQFAPGTSAGEEYADRMMEWAGYCREIINRDSDRPVIPRPPSINRHYLNENREWRMEL